MTTTMNPFTFKGDNFVNRYRITGNLTAKTPLHIGTGERREDSTETNTNASNSESDEKRYIDNIARDWNDHPYLPGSSLRGVVRHYLLQVFRSLDSRLATEVDYEATLFRDMDQDAQVDYMRTKASLLERVFGTPFCETKVEFWDAYLCNKVEAPENLKEKGWDDARQSYVVRSVAIDPETGAAEPNKLYSFDVAPPGSKYCLDIVGQNLSDEELGFLLFGLYGFNSEIVPLTLGAMSGRGFGCFTFELDKIYVLQANELPMWAKVASQCNHAGYNLFGKLSEANVKELIPKFKSAIQSKIEV
ncbi:MAG: RAMP superfamily CRISPR-associated protein [bacterium]